MNSSRERRLLEREMKSTVTEGQHGDEVVRILEWAEKNPSWYEKQYSSQRVIHSNRSRKMN